MTTKELEAYGLGLLAITAFALTLPLTKLLVDNMHALEIGIGRSFIAAVPAAIILCWKKVELPNGKQFIKLLSIAVGIVFVFPILTAVGMNYLPSSHGGAVLAALPLSTAMFGRVVSKEKPGAQFWVLSMTGFLIVLVYTVVSSGMESLYVGDMALLIAVLFAGYGYAQGGTLSREMAGWKVICWVLVVSLPLLSLMEVVIFDAASFLSFEAMDVFALLFLALINTLFGFFAWYRALALGGISKISQIQLLQPFITYAFAILLLQEAFSLLTLAVCVGVIYIVWLTKKQDVQHVAAPKPIPLIVTVKD